MDTFSSGSTSSNSSNSSSSNIPINSNNGSSTINNASTSSSSSGSSAGNRGRAPVFAFLIDSSIDMGLPTSSARASVQPEENSYDNYSSYTSYVPSAVDVNLQTLKTSSTELLSNDFSFRDVSVAAVESFFNVFFKQFGGCTPGSGPFLYLSNTVNSRACVLANMGEWFGTFEDQLKNFRVIEEPNQTFSYSLSYFMNTLTKFRLSSKVDTYGYGRQPWSLHPAHIFIVTSLSGLRRNSSIEVAKNGSSVCLPEMTTSDNWKWDQHINIIVVGENGSKDEICKWMEEERNVLYLISKESGGEVYVFNTLKEASFRMKKIASALFANPPSVTLQLALSESKRKQQQTSYSFDSENFAEKTGKLLCHMFCPATGFWPFPEHFWVKLGGNELLPRPPYPTIRLTPISEDCSGSDTVNLTQNIDKWLLLCRTMNIPTDAYDLVGNPFSLDKIEKGNCGLGGGISSIHGLLKKNGFSKSNAFFVSVDGSSSAESSYGLNIIPFGVFRLNPDGVTFQIIVLPYNFPIFLDVLQSCVENLDPKKSVGNILQRAQTDFQKYVNILPQYYYTRVYRILTALKLLKTIHINADAVQLSKSVYGKVCRAEQSASKDVAHIMEVYSCRNRECQTSARNVDVIALLKATEEDPLKSKEVPVKLSQIGNDSILAQYESMRNFCFGNSSLTLFGLSTDAEAGGRHVPNQKIGCKRLHSETIVLGSETCSLRSVGLNWCCIKGDTYVTKSTKEMGDYSSILAKKQVPRDPFLEIVPGDENDLTGILRRKLEVDFGSKYRKVKPKSNSKLSASGIAFAEDITKEIDIDGFLFPGRTLNEQTMSVPTRSVNEIQTMQDSLFADTPNPYASSEYYDNYLRNDDVTDISGDSGDEFSHSSIAPIMDDFETSASSPVSVTATSTPNQLTVSSSPASNSSKTLGQSTTSVELTNVNSLAKALPHGWTQQFSQRHNKIYWFNTLTGKSSWTFPTAQ